MPKSAPVEPEVQEEEQEPEPVHVPEPTPAPVAASSQSGISPYIPNSATKKAQIDIKKDKNKKKKSVTRLDIERLNSGGLIGDKKRVSSQRSP